MKRCSAKSLQQSMCRSHAASNSFLTVLQPMISRCDLDVVVLPILPDLGSHGHPSHPRCLTLSSEPSVFVSAQSESAKLGPVGHAEATDVSKPTFQASRLPVQSARGNSASKSEMSSPASQSCLAAEPLDMVVKLARTHVALTCN